MNTAWAAMALVTFALHPSVVEQYSHDERARCDSDLTMKSLWKTCEKDLRRSSIARAREVRIQHICSSLSSAPMDTRLRRFAIEGNPCILAQYTLFF